MRLEVKICGLSTPEALDAAVQGGASHAGFVIFPKSPRHIAPEAAGSLARRLPERVRSVAVLVDPDDALLEAVMAGLRPAILQLHGQETQERIAAIRARFGRPVMKAIGIVGPESLAELRAFEAHADLLLFDAKPARAPRAEVPGGHGMSFDWRILSGLPISRPWFLSGGLTAGNLEDAVRATGARALDVSSGVEHSPGVKSPDAILAFLAKAKQVGEGRSALPADSVP